MTDAVTDDRGMDRLGIARQILNVVFGLDAVTIAYLTVPDDLRATGLHLTHELVIPLDCHEYDVEVEAAHRACQALLNDAIEDFQNLDSYDPAQDSEMDDDDDVDQD